MRKRLINLSLLVAGLLVLMGCNSPKSTAVAGAVTVIPVITITEEPTAQPTGIPQVQTATDQVKPAVVPEVNPLTGLIPDQPGMLNRRPVIIKVENLPRDHRPQFGLSFADLVYEYHTEEGTTRYAAIYYGKNAEKVGPIRSGRWFDISLIQMYKGIFIFGSAYADLLTALFHSDFKDRLILEGPGTSTMLQRYDPNGKNLLLANLNKLPEIIASYGIDNAFQPLDGMQFDSQPPQKGQVATRIFVRYSGAIYNRWDYDSKTGRYLRFVDAEDDVNRTHEVYAPMTDQVTGQPIAADNVVMVLAKNFVVTPNVYNIDLTGSEDAYLARDGQIYKVRWTRQSDVDVLSLVDEQRKPVPFKPGTTWFEILSLPTPMSQPSEGVWRFNFIIPEK